MKHIVYIDIETTGFSEVDEIVEIAILDDGGSVLLNTFVKPVDHFAWPEAQKIHGITPKYVKDAPTLDELRDKIIDAIRGHDVVIYNAAYESQYLRPELAEAASISCCMLLYAEHKREWSEYWGNYRWHKLIDAAADVFYEWDGKSHKALADCFATRAVWRYLTNPTEQKRIDDLHAEAEACQEARIELVRLQRQERYAIDKYKKSMTDKLMKQWGYPERSLNFMEKAAKELEYYEIFTGMKKQVWLKYLNYKDKIPMIESLKDIPKYCISEKDISNLPPHLRNEMRPCAFYISTSRKTFKLFYDKREIAKIRRKFKRRKYKVYDRYEDIPAGFLSQSQLKKIGIDVRKEAMTPQAEYYFRCQYGNRYVKLYFQE